MKYTLSPGRYYIGDIYYVLDKRIYYYIWGKKFDFSEGKIKVNNSVFVVGNTKNKNGLYSYKGSNNFIYVVETGVIGIVHEDLIHKNDISLGTIHTFTENVTFTYDNYGVFIIESNDFFLQINTKK
jgi:hypothetical protein